MPAPDNGRRHLAYVLALVLVPLLIVVTGFAISASQLYVRHTNQVGEAMNAAVYDTRGQDADVLFYGDSSMQVGLVTKQFEAETGLSAYGIGIPGSMLIMSPDLGLQAYLARNKRPHLLVLYVAPWNEFALYNGKVGGWYDGISQIIRYGTWARAFEYMLHQPETIFEYPYQFLLYLPSHISLSGDPERTRVAQIKADRGYFFPYANRPRISDDCGMPVEPTKEDVAALKDMARRYSRLVDRIAIYIAPVPDCSTQFGRAIATYRGVPDNEFYVLPSHYFVDDKRQAHLFPDGAQINTTIVAKFVQDFLARSGEHPGTP